MTFLPDLARHSADEARGRELREQAHSSRTSSCAFPVCDIVNSACTLVGDSMAPMDASAASRYAQAHAQTAVAAACFGCGSARVDHTA
eukprot:717374-Pleurochrysis_carterae.AAC.2